MPTFIQSNVRCVSVDAAPPRNQVHVRLRANMRDSSDSDSQPPPRRRGRPAKKPESEMTMVEKHVARMMAARAAEELETVQLGARAESLRKDGEESLRSLRDLDQDSDSEADDDASAGFTGCARRDARRRREQNGIDKNENENVLVRAMTSAELGMAYAWMRRDQRRYENAVKFWDTAASSVQAAFEEKEPPGEPSTRVAIDEADELESTSFTNTTGSFYQNTSTSRVLGVFSSELGPAPVGFAVLRDDALTVDAMGVRQGLRRCGFGGKLVDALKKRAKAAALISAGPPEYVIDALPSSVSFWKSCGFKSATGSDSPTTKVMRRLCGDVAMQFDLLDEPLEIKGDEWWVAARNKRFGGGV